MPGNDWLSGASGVAASSSASLRCQRADFVDDHISTSMKSTHFAPSRPELPSSTSSWSLSSSSRGSSLSLSSSSSSSLCQLSDSSSDDSSVSSGCECLVGLARGSPCSTSSASWLDEEPDLEDQRQQPQRHENDADTKNNDNGQVPPCNWIRFHFQNISNDRWTTDSMERLDCPCSPDGKDPSASDKEEDEDPTVLLPNRFLKHLSCYPNHTNTHNLNDDADSDAHTDHDHPLSANTQLEDPLTATTTTTVQVEDLQSVFDMFVSRDARILHVACACDSVGAAVGSDPLILDLVCAGYHNVVAIDANVSWIRQQISHVQIIGLDELVQFQAMDVTQERLKFADQWFDVVFCHGFLDLLASNETARDSLLQKVLLELTRCLKPGGVLIVVTCRRKEYDESFATVAVEPARSSRGANEATTSLWWQWSHVEPLFRNHFELVHQQAVGVPSVLNRIHVKPFEIRVWRRHETLGQRWTRLRFEKQSRNAQAHSWNAFEAIQRVHLAAQNAASLRLQEMQHMLQEEWTSRVVHQNNLFEQTRVDREEIREQVLAQWLQEEQQAMVREERLAQSMALQAREIQAWIYESASVVLAVALEQAERVIEVNHLQREVVRMVESFLSELIECAVKFGTAQPQEIKTHKEQLQQHSHLLDPLGDQTVGGNSHVKNVPSNHGTSLEMPLDDAEPTRTVQPTEPNCEVDHADQPGNDSGVPVQAQTREAEISALCYETMLELLHKLCIVEDDDSTDSPSRRCDQKVDQATLEAEIPIDSTGAISLSPTNTTTPTMVPPDAELGMEMQATVMNSTASLETPTRDTEKLPPSQQHEEVKVPPASGPRITSVSSTAVLPDSCGLVVDEELFSQVIEYLIQQVETTTSSQ